MTVLRDMFLNHIEGEVQPFEVLDTSDDTRYALATEYIDDLDEWVWHICQVTADGEYEPVETLVNEEAALDLWTLYAEGVQEDEEAAQRTLWEAVADFVGSLL
jgi:hypothetical protein